MADIKCGRCDRTYSAMRSKCPYCGARKRKRSKRPNQPESSKWKMIIGLLLLIILVVAVLVLLITSVADKRQQDDTQDTTTTTQTQNTTNDTTQDGPNGDGVTDITDDPTDDTTQDTTVDTTPAPPSVTGVQMIYGGRELPAYSGDRYDYDISLGVGESIKLSYKLFPEGATETVVWSVSDEAVILVLQEGKVTGVGSGSAVLTITAGEKQATCIVRVR